MAEKDIGDRAIGRMDEGRRSEASQDIQRSASDLGQSAREMAEGSLSQARSVAADNVGRAGEALHAAAEKMGRGDTFGTLIDAAAGQLDAASRALRDRDASRLVHDINDFARRQPALFIGGALAAGFALARFATAGTGQGRHGRHDRHAHDGSAQYQEGSRSPLGYGGSQSVGASPSGEARQEGRLSGAVGGTRGERHVGEPPTTTPGHQPTGARPQARGSSTGMPVDE